MLVKFDLRKLLVLPAATVLISAGAWSAAPDASAATWKLDKSHTSVTFGIRHFLTTVKGNFSTFDGSIEFDPANPEKLKVSGWVDAASIDTDNEKRDKHLRSEDFFDVEKFPKITFEGEKLTDVNASKTSGKLHGTLTMHGVSKPVVIDVKWLGTIGDGYGGTKGGLSGTTTINRKDFGITWNKTLDAGGLMLGEEVEVELSVELNKQD